ncbi:MAG TPA: Clp protease N-terminal domain-containing protein [Longimicrobiales bacterium]|nr:Clp protease N-terminal domain-containing protein [Longimicrobiales bacterium]
MTYDFTEQVRAALGQARAEAIAHRHDYIGPEHILLGILCDGRIETVLREAGVGAEAVRRAVESRLPVGGGSPRRGRGELPYTSWAKRVMEGAMLAARERHAGDVTAEHLLLGLLQQEKSVAARVLRELGVTADSMRSSGSRQRMAFRIEIDDAADRSIYEQIVVQITEAVATGDVRAGERLPTVRQLADQLDVAPGTVARAYSELERQGLVVTEGARGTRVAERAVPSHRELEPDALAGLLRPVAVAAFHLGATASQLRAALEEAMRGIFDKRDHAA